MAVNARAWLLTLSLGALPSCAVTMQGVVVDHGPGVALQTADSGRFRLITVGDAAPVAHLEGHIAIVSGRRVLRTVTVGDWKVIEGLHGMTAWVGPIRWMGTRLVLEDRNSGSVFTLDDQSIGALGDSADAVVLVEGYIDGPNHVKVLYFRVLE